MKWWISSDKERRERVGYLELQRLPSDSRGISRIRIEGYLPVMHWIEIYKQRDLSKNDIRTLRTLSIAEKSLASPVD